MRFPASHLRQINLFAACTPPELAVVDRLVQEVEFLAGEVVLSEREMSFDSFIILVGEATVIAGDRSLARLGPGDFFGWLARMAPERPHAATVMAISSMQCLVVPPDHVRTLLNIPSVARSVLGALLVSAATSEAGA